MPSPDTRAVVLVCGSREWHDRDLMKDTFRDVLFELDPPLARDIVVIHGAARGADQMAAEILAPSIYEVRAFPADLVALLAEVYRPDGIRIWLRGRHRPLGERRPLDLIAEGNTDEVAAIVHGLIDGVFV